MGLVNVSGYEVSEEVEKEWKGYENLQSIMYDGESAGLFHNSKFVKGNYKRGIGYIASSLDLIENARIDEEIVSFGRMRNIWKLKNLNQKMEK